MAIYVYEPLCDFWQGNQVDVAGIGWASNEARG